MIKNIIFDVGKVLKSIDFLYDSNSGNAVCIYVDLQIFEKQE